MVLTHNDLHYDEGLLYPLMVIAAVAVIVFSLLGMASVSGWMPRALSEGGSAVELSATSEPPETAAADPARAAFGCAECGVIKSVRDIERRGSSADAPAQ